jgi:Flp pilus assembly protein TadG
MSSSKSGRTRWVLCDRGAAALEFAILLPVLLLMLYGFIEGSRMYQARLAMSYAAREGARVLAVGTHDTAAARATVLSRAYPLSSARLSVGTSVDTGNDVVRVTVSYAYLPLLLPDIDWTIPPVSVEMRAE